MFCMSLSVAVEGPDFKAGVASLAQLLQVPPHQDHTIVLKVDTVNFCYLKKNKTLTENTLVWCLIVECVCSLEIHLCTTCTTLCSKPIEFMVYQILFPELMNLFLLVCQNYFYFSGCLHIDKREIF